MKNYNKTTGKFSIDHFEVAKLKNSNLIIGGDVPVQIVTTRPRTTDDTITNPSQTNTTRTSIAGNTIAVPPKPV